jgi:hypothetical protein
MLKKTLLRIRRYSTMSNQTLSHLADQDPSFLSYLTPGISWIMTRRAVPPPSVYKVHTWVLRAPMNCKHSLPHTWAIADQSSRPSISRLVPVSSHQTSSVSRYDQADHRKTVVPEVVSFPTCTTAGEAGGFAAIDVATAPVSTVLSGPCVVFEPFHFHTTGSLRSHLPLSPEDKTGALRDTTSSHDRPHCLTEIGSTDFGSLDSPIAASPTSSYTPDVLICTYDNCGLEFRGRFRRGTLQRHFRLNHRSTGRQEYPCEIYGCPKSYRRQDSRLKHYRRCHSDVLDLPAMVRRK